MNSIRHFPLRIAIQSIFISIFVILVGVILTISGFQYSKSVAMVSKKLMANTATNVIQHMNSDLVSIDKLINLTQSLMENNFIATQQQLVDYSYFIAKNVPPLCTK